MTHICVSRLTIIGSDNGLSSVRRQGIIWINTGLLSIGPLRTYFNVMRHCGYFVSASMCKANIIHVYGRWMWNGNHNVDNVGCLSHVIPAITDRNMFFLHRTYFGCPGVARTLANMVLTYFFQSHHQKGSPFKFLWLSMFTFMRSGSFGCRTVASY